MGDVPTRWLARLFRWSMCVYPPWFRAAHGDEMEELFLARLARARGIGGRVRLWARVVADATWTVVALRRRQVSDGPHAARRIEMLWQDMRHAVRHLARTPVFTLGAVALLAVGIGANTAVYTLVDRLLIRDLPYDQPDEVVYVYQDSDDGEPGSCSFPAYRDMTASDVFRAVTAISPSQATWESGAGAVDVMVEYTTASYLEVAGLAVQRGRWFSPEHDVAGAQPVAVISAPTWRTRFGADPGIVGRTIRLNGVAVTVIGVGPAELTGSFPPVITDFWLSISATVVGGQFRVANLERREDHWYGVRARLADGTTAEQAGAAMDALAARLAEGYPDLNRGRRITVRPATEVSLYPESRGALVLLSVLVGILLLLAGANLANLLLVRGIGRSGEVAVRRALGAGAARVWRFYLVESVVLSVAGGLVGLVFARGLLAALQAAPLPFPFSAGLDLAIDGRIGLFAVALMVGTGVLFGLAPAARSLRDDVTSVLRQDGRTSSLGRGTVRYRNGLVVVQVAASLVLVLTAGLLARSLGAMQDADTGVDADRVAGIRVNLSQAGLGGEELATTLEEIRSRVEALPGVTSAAAASRLPAQFSGTTTTIVEGYTPPAGTDAVELSFSIVTPEYFDTMGLRLLEGRGFAPTDVAGADRVVIVNQAAAERFWGGDHPVGRRLRSQGQPDVARTVVGVAENAPVGEFPERPTRPMFYAPAGQAILGSAYVLARTDGEPAALLGPMRAIPADVRASLSIQAQGTLADHFGAALAVPRFTVRAMSVVSLLAVLLAALGIYAVVAFNVARRSAELGIRMALGADPRRVIRMVVAETGRTVALGMAGGLVLAALAVGRLESVLYGVAPLDPVTFVIAVAVLTVVAWIAAYVPARRAALADPTRALKAS